VTIRDERIQAPRIISKVIAPSDEDSEEEKSEDGSYEQENEQKQFSESEDEEKYNKDNSDYEDEVTLDDLGKLNLNKNSSPDFLNFNFLAFS
jgi:hypothetical protein